MAAALAAKKEGAESILILEGIEHPESGTYQFTGHRRFVRMVKNSGSI